MKIYEYQQQDLTCTNNTENWFSLSVPAELLIMRFVVAEQSTAPGAFSAGLYKRKLDSSPPAWQLALNEIVPMTGASSGVVRVDDTTIPATTVLSNETNANMRTLYLRITGSGLNGKKYAVSISSIVGGARQ